MKRKGRKGVRERTTKIQQSTISYLSSSQTSALLCGIVTEERQWTAGKERQREGAENTRIRRNLPLFIGCCFIVVVSSLSEVDKEGAIDATAFREQ